MSENIQADNINFTVCGTQQKWHCCLNKDVVTYVAGPCKFVLLSTTNFYHNMFLAVLWAT